MSFCATLCHSKFNVSATQAFLASNRLGWCFDVKQRSTNLETAVTGFDITLDTFRSFFTRLIWIWSANFEVMSVVSEPVAKSALASTVCHPFYTFTGCTYKKVCILYIFLINWSWTCWSLLPFVSCIEMILINGLKRSFTPSSSHTSNKSRVTGLFHQLNHNHMLL